MELETDKAFQKRKIALLEKHTKEYEDLLKWAIPILLILGALFSLAGLYFAVLIGIIPALFLLLLAGFEFYKYDDI